MPPKFDMQAARDACAETIRENHLPCKICDGEFCAFCSDAKKMLPAALDEIDRLQKANLELNVAIMGPDQIRAHQGCIIEDQSERIAELEGAAKADESRLIAAAQKAGIAYFGCDTPDHLAERVVELEGNHCADCCCARSWEALDITEYTGRSIPEEITRLKDDLIASNHRYLDLQQVCDDQDKRIAELESALSMALTGGEGLSAIAKRYVDRSEKQRAALKILGQRAGKRGKALVEERARWLLEGISPEDKFDLVNLKECPRHDVYCDDCSIKRCPSEKFWKTVARQQLRQERVL